MRMLRLGRRVSFTTSSSPGRSCTATRRFRRGRGGAVTGRSMTMGANDADASAVAADAVARLAGQPPPRLSPDLWRLLADSHAHPQLADYGAGGEEQSDDPQEHSPFSAAAAKETARQTLARLLFARVACMSVGAGVDWARVEALAEMDLAASSSGGGERRIIAAYGIHPWWAHLHGAEAEAGGGGGDGGGGETEETGGMRSLLEAPDEAEMQAALQSVARAAADGRLGLYHGGEEGEAADAAAADPPSHRPLPPVSLIPFRAWMPRLRALLEKHPHAIVGETGLDRAAVIPGTKRARCSPAHQLALLRAQLSLAAELGRPVSLHCVRAQGAMYDELRGRALATAEGGGGAAGLPPRVMMHSFGGAAEEVARFSALEALASRGRAAASSSSSSPTSSSSPASSLPARLRPPRLCPRVYFSFSAAINQQRAARTDARKLADRIRAVPADRLLLESDEVTPGGLGEGLARSLALVAAARGWGLEETARTCRANFDAFYEPSL